MADVSKPIIIEVQRPGYETPTKYSMAGLLDSYDALAKTYGVTDSDTQQYYNQMIEALNKGELKINNDGTLSVTGDSLGLRNQYENVDQVSDEYKYATTDKQGKTTMKARRGVDNTLNDIDAKKHGIFTSKKTGDFRDNQKAKAIAAAMVLKALGNKDNFYTESSSSTDTTPKDFTGEYFNNLLKKRYVGGTDNFTPEQKIEAYQQVIADALNDAPTYYPTVKWDKTMYDTQDKWIAALNAAQKALEDGKIDTSDNPILSSIGAVWQTQKPETPAASRDIDKPWLWGKDEWINEKLKGTEGETEEWLEAERARLGHKYDTDVTKHNASPAESLNQTLQQELEDETNKAYQDYLAYDPSALYQFPATQVYGPTKLPITGQTNDYPIESLGSDNPANFKEIIQDLNVFGTNGNYENNNLSTAEAPLTQERINEIGSKLSTVARLHEKLKSVYQNADPTYPLKKQLYYNWLINLQKAFNLGEDGSMYAGFIQPDPTKQRIYLKYVPNTGFIWVPESQVNPGREAAWKAEYKKNRNAEKKQQGGILKAQSGTRLYTIEDALNSLDAQGELEKSQLKGKTGGERIAGFPGDFEGIQLTEGRFAPKFSAADKWRLGAILADLVSVATPSAISAGIGLGSTAANTWADIQDGTVNWWDTGAALGLDIASALPIFGIGAKYAKLTRLLRPMGKMLTAYALYTNAPGAWAALKKLEHPETLTVDDWRSIAYLVQGIVSSKNRSSNLNKLDSGRMGTNEFTKLDKNQTKWYVGANPNPKTFHPVEIQGQRVNLSHEDFEKFRASKSVDERKKILSQAQDVVTGQPIKQDVVDAVVHDNSSWYNRFRDSDLESKWFNFGTERKLSNWNQFSPEFYSQTPNQTRWGSHISDTKGQRVSNPSTPKPTTSGAATSGTTPAASQTNGIMETVQTAFAKKLESQFNAKRQNGVLSREDFKQILKDNGISLNAVQQNKLYSQYKNSVPSNKRGGSLNFAKNILSFKPGGPITYQYEENWNMPTWWKFGNALNGFDSKTYEANYDTMAATTRHGNIDNIWHHNPTVQSRFKLNQQYTSAGNYSNRDKDIQHALDGFFAGKGDTTDISKYLQDTYNQNVDNITNFHNDPNRKWKDAGATGMNDTHNTLYGSLNETNALGFDKDQKDVYGSTSYLRIPQQYETEFSDQLKDDEFKNRVHVFDKDGQKYYFGVQANGHIIALNDEQKKRYDKLVNPTTTGTGTETSTETGNGSQDSNQPKGSIKPGNLDQLLSDQYKYGNWQLRPDLFTEAARAAGTIHANNAAWKERLKFKPLLTSTWRQAPVLVHGNMPLKEAAEAQKAQGLNIASQPITSDASLNTAAKLQATVQGQALQNDAKAKDTEMFYHTNENAIAAMNADRERENINYNRNIDTLNAYSQDLHNNLANLKLANWGVIDNGLAALTKALQQEQAALRQARFDLAKDDAARREQQALQQYLVDHNHNAYQQAIKDIYKDQRFQTVEGLGYKNVFFTPQLTAVAAKGTKFSYKRRQKEAGASDFNKAIESSKKAFYNAVQFNHKYKKR